MKNDVNFNKVDTDDVAYLNWANKVNYNQEEFITTITYELEEDAYESDSLPEPEVIQAMMYG